MAANIDIETGPVLATWFLHILEKSLLISSLQMLAHPLGLHLYCFTVKIPLLILCGNEFVIMTVRGINPINVMRRLLSEPQSHAPERESKKALLDITTFSLQGFLNLLFIWPIS